MARSPAIVLARAMTVFVAFAFPAVNCAATPEAVAEAQPRGMAMVWNIQQQAPETDPVTAKVYATVAKTRLVPPALYLLDQPAKLPDGLALLDAGTELAALTGVERTACTMRVPTVAARMKPASALWSRKNRYLCLQDRDGDGRFDGYLWLYTATLTAFLGKWPILPVEGRTALVGYHLADPTTSQQSPWLKLVFQNDASWVGKVRIVGVVANADTTAPMLSHLAPEIDVSVKTLPVQFDAFGGKFEILAKDKGIVTVRTIKPIPSAPLWAGW